MRRLGAPAAFIALLAAGGFAAVSIAQGGGLAHVTTTGLTVTTAGKVTLCHRTHSKKHPFVTISVGAPAARAHLAHGDVLGRCTAATIATMKRHGNKHTTTTTTGATQTTAPTHGNSGTHGNGNATSSVEHGNGGSSGSHGNSGNHGGGHH